MKKGLLLAAVLAAAPGLAAVAQKEAAAAPAAAVAADVERGRAVWNFRCYFCHGYSGDAKTLATTFVNPPPRDFQSARPEEFPLSRIENGIRHGMPGTTMKPFTGTLTEQEIRDVAAFVRSEFLEKRAPNTSYHTEANGWPRHERYADAFAFARGEIALDADPASLTPPQRRGRALFVETCITCHDRSHVLDEGLPWQAVKN